VREHLKQYVVTFFLGEDLTGRLNAGVLLFSFLSFLLHLLLLLLLLAAGLRSSRSGGLTAANLLSSIRMACSPGASPAPIIRMP